MKAESLSSLPRQNQASKFKAHKRKRRRRMSCGPICLKRKQRKEILLSGFRTVPLAMCFWQMTGNWQTLDILYQPSAVWSLGR